MWLQHFWTRKKCRKMPWKMTRKTRIFLKKCCMWKHPNLSTTCKNNCSFFCMLVRCIFPSRWFPRNVFGVQKLQVHQGPMTQKLYKENDGWGVLVKMLNQASGALKLPIQQLSLQADRPALKCPKIHKWCVSKRNWIPLIIRHPVHVPPYGASIRQLIKYAMIFPIFRNKKSLHGCWITALYNSGLLIL